MRSIEISARTVAEATRLALEQLGVDEDEVMIAVLQSGDEDNEALVRVSVEGVDEETVGLMIGRRGETLRSLQFLLNTIVQRTSGRWPQLVVDVGNYRQRRQESLEGLARRVAEQVRATGRPVPLEPMQSYDRRIIHMALRSDDTVYTESSGEGESRRITIFPRS